MQIDKTTFNDLDIFDHREELSIFVKLDHTETVGGREILRRMFSRPLSTVSEISGIQQTVQLIRERETEWPRSITNGTLMVIQKFYESGVDGIPNNPSVVSAYIYKIFHGPDFSLIKYSISHCVDFITGMQQLINTFNKGVTPLPLQQTLKRAVQILDKPQLTKLAGKKSKDLGMIDMLQLARFILYHYRNNIFDLLDIYCQVDAWHSMAKAMEKHALVLPRFLMQDQPQVTASGLYHVLLPAPTVYDINLDPEKNFIFLTGANMAGKSTFIKAVGAAVFLAHIGMGVPAKKMELTLTDGLLSNINVADNIVKGESYFFNEVQRIKNTILKINDGKKWLVLIDELFKGTNIQDAMKCSTAVIEGLVKMRNSLFILSTHLYEISEGLKNYSDINFKYFETKVAGDQLEFNYELKDGVSDDRLGYLILKNEGVVEMLKNL